MHRLLENRLREHHQPDRHVQVPARVPPELQRVKNQRHRGKHHEAGGPDHRVLAVLHDRGLPDQRDLRDQQAQEEHPADRVAPPDEGHPEVLLRADGQHLRHHQLPADREHHQHHHALHLLRVRVQEHLLVPLQELRRLPPHREDAQGEPAAGLRGGAQAQSEHLRGGPS